LGKEGGGSCQKRSSPKNVNKRDQDWKKRTETFDDHSTFAGGARRMTMSVAVGADRMKTKYGKKNFEKKKGM